MLGSKTKRVAAYGKRTHRIVANDSFDAASAGGRTAAFPRIAVTTLDDPVLGSSPLTSPDRPEGPSPMIKKKPTTRKKVTPKSIGGPTSVRPLASREPAVSINIEYERVVKPSKKHGKKPSPLQAVDVELVTSDEDITVATERMVLETGARVNHVITPLPPQPQGNEKNAVARESRNTHREKPAITDTISDSEPELPPRQKRAATRRRQVIVSSDEDEFEAQNVARTPIPPSPSPLYLPPPSHSPSSPPAPAPNSPREYPSPVRAKPRCSSPRPPQYDPITNKPRQLTPIRRGKKPFPRSPGSVISLEDDESDWDDTNVDDLLKFADLSCSDYHDHAREVPNFLLPLLQECNQESPHEFSSFINSFPFDQIVQSYESELAAYSKAEFRKVGEASYSEVFGIGSVVLKIVPLRDESETKPTAFHVESPPTSYARDVLQEIAATRLMGELCEGIVKLLRTYVVRGKYPSLLLSLWDEYNDVNGSESIKPGEEDAW